LANRRPKHCFCDLVSEYVEIALKNKAAFGSESKTDLFVQCNQLDCQYVDLNQAPCPLGLDLFVEEIERRAKKHRDRGLNSETNGSLVVAPFET
jgi:hypothetical protein